MEQEKRMWLGSAVLFDDRVYNVVVVDNNGALMIDKPAEFTETTAVGAWMVKVV